MRTVSSEIRPKSKVGWPAGRGNGQPGVPFFIFYFTLFWYLVELEPSGTLRDESPCASRIHHRRMVHWCGRQLTNWPMGQSTGRWQEVATDFMDFEKASDHVWHMMDCYTSLASLASHPSLNNGFRAIPVEQISLRQSIQLHLKGFPDFRRCTPGVSLARKWYLIPLMIMGTTQQDSGDFVFTGDWRDKCWLHRACAVCNMQTTFTNAVTWV